MCSFSPEESPYDVPLVFSLHHPWPSKKHRHHLRLSLHKRRRAQLQEARRRWRQRMIVMKTEIKMKNLKLYMENQSIIEENEKLRNQAVLLHKENQTLLIQLQNKISEKENYIKTN